MKPSKYKPINNKNLRISLGFFDPADTFLNKMPTGVILGNIPADKPQKHLEEIT